MSNQLTTTDQHEDRLPAVGGVYGSIQSFEDAQRMSTALAASSLVPDTYQGNKANCMIALEMSQRIGASPMAVMQNLHIIHGRPSWSSQFVIAALNSCGRFSALRFRVTGTGDDETCVAWATDRSGEVLEGPPVSIGMAKAEGWYSKNGSKWKTMPQLMLRYRAAKFFGNLYAPDVLMGMHTADEVEDFGDTGPIRVQNQAAPSAANDNKQKGSPLDDLNEFGNKHGTRSATEALDGELLADEEKPTPRQRRARSAPKDDKPNVEQQPDADAAADADVVDAELVEDPVDPSPAQQQTDANTEPPKDLF